MERKLVLTVLLAVCAAAARLHADEKVGAKLQELCVTIKKGGNDRGSGVVVTRPIDGKPVNWILTCAHVVDGMRVIRDVIAPDGTPRKEVTYRDAEVLQELRDSGRRVGETVLDAKIINVDTKADLALLRIRKAGYTTATAKFCPGTDPPGVGRAIYHCGSPGGTSGAASLTRGIVSQVGRLFEEFSAGEYDQVDCAALPGSSGGGIWDAETGEVLGVVSLGVRGADNFHYMIPTRRIRRWAERTGVMWLVDEKAKAPTEAEVEKIPLENQSVGSKPDVPNKPAAAPKVKPALKIQHMITNEAMK